MIALFFTKTFELCIWFVLFPCFCLYLSHYTQYEEEARKLAFVSYENYVLIRVDSIELFQYIFSTFSYFLCWKTSYADFRVCMVHLCILYIWVTIFSYSIPLLLVAYVVTYRCQCVNFYIIVLLWKWIAATGW